MGWGEREGGREGRSRREREKERGCKQEREDEEEGEGRKGGRKRHWILILSEHLISCVCVLDVSEAAVFLSVK